MCPHKDYLFIYYLYSSDHIYIASNAMCKAIGFGELEDVKCNSSINQV